MSKRKPIDNDLGAACSRVESAAKAFGVRPGAIRVSLEAGGKYACAVNGERATQTAKLTKTEMIWALSVAAAVVRLIHQAHEDSTD